MRDSSGNAQDYSNLFFFLFCSLVVNVGQFFIANDAIRGIEAHLAKKDQEISQLKEDKAVLEGKFQGFVEGRR